METNRINAIKSSGIFPAHAIEISRIARENNAFILFRPVNPNSTSLIAAQFGTNGLDIHSKSSDWGPQAGFICENQLLSKADNLIGIEKGNQDSAHSLSHSNGKVVRFPLLLPMERVAELADQKQGKQLIRIDGNWDNSFVKKVIVYPTKALGSKPGTLDMGLVDYKDRALFMRSLDVGLRNECENAYASMAPRVKTDTGHYIVVYRMPGGSFGPVFALGYAGGLPVTADYDVFAICPNLTQSKSVMQKSLILDKMLGKKPDLLKATMRAMQHGLGHQDRNVVNAQMGRITAFQQKIKNAINAACNGPRNPVVHHGTEMDNTQFPEQDGQITIFTPRDGIGVTMNWTEVQNVGQDILRLGYVFYRNRCYVANEQNLNMNQGKKFYFGQGENNPNELAGNGKSFVWAPQIGEQLQVLQPLLV